MSVAGKTVLLEEVQSDFQNGTLSNSQRHSHLNRFGGLVEVIKVGVHSRLHALPFTAVPLDPHSPWISPFPSRLPVLRAA